MLNPKMLKQLDSRDELVLMLLAGFIPLMTFAAVVHQTVGVTI
jgi:hypothetical protein